MVSSRFRKVVAVALVVLALLFVREIVSRLSDQGGGGKGRNRQAAVPVEVADIDRGPMELRRTFSGALEASAKFIVAPKVGGRIVRMNMELADTVTRGQVVAELDSDEYVQAVAQAKAERAVAQANLAEAESVLQFALRDVKRTETLLRQKIANESEFDVARQTKLEREARVKVAEAQLKRADATLETANIRLGYTTVMADWTGPDTPRVVAERYADEGDTVSANQPLLLIVSYDPIIGVIAVTEKDYARLQQGQGVTLTTDAYPGETFTGQIERVAPVFRESTRQARVELAINNPDHRLKPGMFIRAEVVLARLPEATIIPDQALTMRGDRSGIFVVSEDGKTVAWREVTVGIRENDRLQVEGQGLSGRVVILAQHLLEDGSAILLPTDEGSAVTGKAGKERK